MRRRSRHIAQRPRLEILEPRIVLGYVSGDRIDESPNPIAPIECPCNIVATPEPNTHPPTSVSTVMPVRDFDGTPFLFSSDLPGAAAPYGLTWGHTRSWSGLNNSGPNGNGWAIGEMPYLVVGGGTNGASSPGGSPGSGYLDGTESDDRITLVLGGTATYTFEIEDASPGATYTSYATWGDSRLKLEWAPDPSHALRLTDS